jgi:hypothetical protein
MLSSAKHLIIQLKEKLQPMILCDSLLQLKDYPNQLLPLACHPCTSESTEYCQSIIGNG